MQIYQPNTQLSTEISAAAYSLLRSLNAPLRAYQDWRTASTSADQLHRLSNRELADLGFVRGELDAVAETLAARRR